MIHSMYGYHKDNLVFLQKSHHISDFKLSPTLKYVLLTGIRKKVSTSLQLLLVVLHIYHLCDILRPTCCSDSGCTNHSVTFPPVACAFM